MNIIEQLTDIYFKYEDWHKYKLPYEEAYKYHDIMYHSGNIIVYQEDETVFGYVEFWRVNFEQFGRIVCGVTFVPIKENVADGNIAYLANTWIHPDKRSGNVIKYLKAQWLKKNFTADYFVGEARRKKSAPIKVIDRTNKLSLIEV